jgi:hypothetical protein
MRQLKTGKEKTHVKELGDNSGNVINEVGWVREITQSRGDVSDYISNLSDQSGELIRVDSRSLNSSFCEVVQLQNCGKTIINTN